MKAWRSASESIIQKQDARGLSDSHGVIIFADGADTNSTNTQIRVPQVPTSPDSASNLHPCSA